VHSTFTVGSINAGIALYSMLTVALSGVAGRFLYVRVHRDLHGEKLSLGEMRKHVTGDDTAMAKLRFAPDVQAALQAYEDYTLSHEGRMLSVMWHAPLLHWRRWRTERRCHESLRMRLLALSKTEGWSQKDFRRRLRASRALTSDFLRTAQSIAEFSAWDKLFSLWHVVHVPFVYMMVLSAVAHVVAVHAY